ncbi:MAG: Alkaline phosphatase synthesis transcriptional regulatory protein PhoP [Phycisphaerae bacterium]|nr:Alkaline phosphatase synthesis transcriptional regulatory protein PhoP [Phycisphaerae bacterium]
MADLDLNGRRILLVDDDPDIVTSIQTTLDGSGAEVKVARDGTAAVTEHEQFKPDLVILDMMLPGRSGFLVLEKIKPRGATAPKVIMITGNPGSRHKQYAETLGVNAYINKPFRMEKLTDTIGQLIGK